MSSGSTIDAVCRGELEVEQPREGYRFNIDAVLLARFATQAQRTPPETIVDLGAGCGVVGLLLLRAWPKSRLRMVEIQPEMAALARRNAERNGLARQVEVSASDLRRVEGWSRALSKQTVVVCNPPFFPLGQGLVNPDRRVAIARHEVCCTLDQLTAAICSGLPLGGTLVLVHLAQRRTELLQGMARRGLAPETLRVVQPLPDRPPTRLLIAARKAGATEGGSLRELAPLVLNQRPGRYSAEVRRMLNEPDGAA